MKFKYINYSTQIWSFSFLVGPIILGTAVMIEEGQLLSFGEIFGGYLIFVILGAICSLPAYGVIILTNEFIFNSVFPNVFLGKIFSTIISSFIVFALFYIFINLILKDEIDIFSDEGFSSPIVLAYALAVISAIWRYEPTPKV